MIKATFIIPYDEISDEVYSSLGEVSVEGVIFNTTQIIGTQEIFLKESDSDVIIARGVTYLALKRNMTNTSVIEIVVTGYDVIRAIDECKKKYKPGKIAVIGAETMTFGAESLQEIMDVEIEVFCIENEEGAVNAIEAAKCHGADAIVSGLMTYRLAKSMGWNCVWIRTGKESIRQAVKEALNAVDVIRLERAKAETFKIILENAKEAIIAVNQDGNVTAFNRAARIALNISQTRMMTGQPISEIMPSMDILKVIKNGEEESGVIDTINDTMIVSNRVPIKTSGYMAGAVITFQNVDKIQEIESKIRKELSNKGLVAKYSFGNIVGGSRELNKTIQTAYKYSQVDSNILLIGETGTGKELFAQSIHNASSRNIQPFVAVNCAALPENLLESELFGYVEGAFSGAIKGGKPGLFELAHKGTIFLDEIGEIPVIIQAKLLRVLQEREIRRIGDDRVIPVDVRIISATNIDLKLKAMKGEFRQDLLYRLDVLNLRIPPLRERNGDVEHIARHFLKNYCGKFQKLNLELSPGAIEVLNEYEWPGNIRELRNICERLAVITEAECITDDDVRNILDLRGKEQTAEGADLREIMDKEANLSVDDDMEEVLRLMKILKLNKTEAARILGVSRTTLWRKLKEKN